MAFTSIAALAAGAEATTALVLGAVTEVGVTMTVVGAVTGSKDLMQIGAVMGAVGGIGGAIAGGATAAAAAGADAVNSFDSGAMQGLVNGASGAVDTGASIGAANALSDGNYAGADMSQFGGDTTSPVATSTVQAQPLAPASTTAAPTTTVTQAADQTSVQPITPPPGASVNDVAGAQAPTGVTEPVGAQGPADVSTPYSNPTDMRLASGTQQPPGGPDLTSDSLFSKFSDWATKNKTLFNAGVQVIGGALSGMNQRDIADQKMALQRDMWNRANSAGTFAPTTTGIVGRAAA
jgi:hypothetical protein